MEKSYVTNNYLRAALNEINDFIEKGQEPPEELFMEFISELRVSNLLIPGFFEGEDLVSETVSSDEDGSTVILLYTDDDEFIKDKGLDYELSPIPNDIRCYMDIVDENDYVGVVINLSSESFFIPAELLTQLPFGPEFSINDNFKGYGPDQLRNIAENASNDSLVDFIGNPYNEDNFEDLMLELTKSTLLNVIVSDEDFEKYADDGILFSDDVENSQMWDLNTGEDIFGMLFTSRDAIINVIDNPELYYAYQISILSKFFDYVLRSDMGGVIINPELDDYFIPRSFLLTYSNVMDNPSFKQAIDYAFLL